VCAKLNTIFARAKQKSFEKLDMRFFETKKYFRVSNPNSFRTKRKNIFSLLSSGGGQKKKKITSRRKKRKKERKKRGASFFPRARTRSRRRRKKKERVNTITRTNERAR